LYNSNTILQALLKGFVASFGIFSLLIFAGWRVDRSVDVLVAAGGIPFWTTFLREEKDSKKSKEDH
jgi:hypothetical protein